MAPALSKEEALRRLHDKQVAYAEQIRETYAEAERVMIGKVARRIERGIDLSEGKGWAERKLAEVTALNRDIGVQVADLRKLDPKIEDAINAAYDDGADVAANELIAANLPDLHADIALARGAAARTLAAATVDALQSTHFRILRSTGDAYRSIVAEAAAQVTTGTQTRRQAAQAALNRFADAGISGFVDTAGRKWDMASYVETAVRSTVMQASNQGHIDKLAANDHDLVIVSAHGDCCPLCGPWENRVLSISGESTQFPSVATAEAAGLHHCNCRHVLDIYLPGYTRPRDEHPYDPEAYQERQKQRQIERGVRKWKRREVAAITDSEKTLAKAKVAEWQAGMRGFIKDTGRRRDYGRESVTRAR
jgi:hypothetical protein